MVIRWWKRFFSSSSPHLPHVDLTVLPTVKKNSGRNRTHAYRHINRALYTNKQCINFPLVHRDFIIGLAPRRAPLQIGNQSQLWDPSAAGLMITSLLVIPLPCLVATLLLVMQNPMYFVDINTLSQWKLG